MPLKVKEMIRLLEADGWFLVAFRGSHRQYKHNAKKGRVTVPGKLSQDLNPDTERDILRQSGLRR
jgi:predicted RNA binding protein YcfA (HicA-like mRNA interferase family)